MQLDGGGFGRFQHFLGNRLRTSLIAAIELLQFCEQLVRVPYWRGFGRTAHSGEAYWFPEYLADLHELVKHYSADLPVNLVGHSMGGNVASLYAGVMPERVSKIVNIEGFGLADSDPNNAPNRYRDWLVANEAEVKFTSYTDFHNLAQKIRKRNPALDDVRADFIAREWAAEFDGAIQLRADPHHKLPTKVNLV